MWLNMLYMEHMALVTAHVSVSPMDHWELNFRPSCCSIRSPMSGDSGPAVQALGATGQVPWTPYWTFLVGGLEHFLFSHILGIIIPLTNIFQRDWNHQPVSFLSGKTTRFSEIILCLWCLATWVTPWNPVDPYRSTFWVTVSVALVPTTFDTNRAGGFGKKTHVSLPSFGV